MPEFMIERHIPGASTLTAPELQEIAAKSNAVAAALGEPYTWHSSYVAGNTIYCVHEAGSEEAVRRHAHRGGFPADKVTMIGNIIGPHTADS